MKVQGTTTTPTSRPPALASSWEDVRSIEEIPDLVAAGRIEPNANVKITTRMRAEPERDGTEGIRPRLYDALSAQANDQIRFDGKKTDESWLYGDEWIIEIPARRFEPVWNTLQSFATDASFDAEIGPPVPDYSAPPEPEPEENEALAGPTKALMLGGVGVAAWMAWQYMSLE